VEQFVPADEHVTVVGTPRQGDEPGQVVVDEAPPDDLLGTHADYTDGDGSDADAVLIRGRYGEAASQPVGGSMGRDSRWPDGRRWSSARVLALVCVDRRTVLSSRWAH